MPVANKKPTDATEEEVERLRRAVPWESICCREEGTAPLRRGIGYGCENPGCRMYLHPGDTHFEPLDRYMRAVRAWERAERVKAAD